MKKSALFITALAFSFNANAQNVGDPCTLITGKNSKTVGSYENVTVSKERNNNNTTSRTNTNSRNTNYSGNVGVNGSYGNENLGKIGASASFGISRNNSRSNSTSNSKSTTTKETESYNTVKCVPSDRYKTTVW